MENGGLGALVSFRRDQKAMHALLDRRFFFFFLTRVRFSEDKRGTRPDTRARTGEARHRSDTREEGEDTNGRERRRARLESIDRSAKERARFGSVL